MPTPRELADTFQADWLAAHPFEASYDGIPGYEDRVPDASEAGEAARRSVLEAVLVMAHTFDDADLSDAEVTTLGCLVGHVEQELAELDSSAEEHAVTAMPFTGPAQLLAVAARTVLPDAQAADDYLTRLRLSGAWIDQHIGRLEIGARKGRLPVAPLVEQAVAWAEGVLEAPVPVAITEPQPPKGWDGESSWREQRDAVATEVVKPALSRWAELLRTLLPRARAGEQAGLTNIPGGDADYVRAIRSHTTLPLTAEDLHQRGLDEIEALERRALRLGAALELVDLAQVHNAIRASAGLTGPLQAMEAALQAVRLGELHLAQVLPPPLPDPCSISPMPPVVAASGMAPHYTPPRLDGTRPGTYWFNTELPTAGTGWDLESVAFHEAVPGHHVQFSRLQMLNELPDMQRQRYLAVFSEGWGLYAERLAEEMDLYSGTEALLGATSAELLRAARLVIDTGLHTFGWGRAEALEFFVAHVPMPAGFLAAEVDRYIVWPGQALAYLTGKLELLRIREDVQRRLGPEFSLPEFHAAVLDSGSLPIPVLRHSIDRWAAHIGS